MIASREKEAASRTHSNIRALRGTGPLGVAHIAQLAIAGCVLFMGACSLMNPYVRSDLLKCEQATDQDATCAKPDVGHAGADKSPYVGEAASAIRAANDQRNLYIKEMGGQYEFNSAAGLGMLALSADAIYKGLTSKSASSTRWVAAEGAAVAGIYGVDTWLHNKSTEAAYVVGFQAITCTLLRTRAILLPVEEYRRFDGDIVEFENQIKEVDSTLSKLQIAWDFGEEAGKSLEKGEQANLKRETGNVYTTLAKSRKLLLTARSYEAEINASGQTIRNQVDLIIASVSSQLAQSEPDVSALKGLVGTYSDPSKGIAGLQGVALTASGTSVTPPVESADKTSSGTSPSKPVAGVKAVDGVEPLSAPSGDYWKRQQLRVDLWTEVSELYALGRKINAVLDSAQHFYTSTKRISACDLGGGPPPLEVTPATVADPVSPGSTLKFSISGGTGIPAVSLTGSTGSGAADAKTPDLVVSVNGNSLTAAVTILSGASGTLTLLASDKGTPPQQAKVTMEVEKSSTPAKSAFKAVVGDKKIALSFPTPTAKGGTLSGYDVTVSTDGPPSGNLTLKFSSPKEGTKATIGATLAGEIAAVSGGNTNIEVTGLTNGQVYSVGLTATFSGAPDDEFEPVANLKPTGPAATTPKPTGIAKITSVTSKEGEIEVIFTPPRSVKVKGYTAKATNKDKKDEVLEMDGAADAKKIDIPHCAVDASYAVSLEVTPETGSAIAVDYAKPIKCAAAAASPPSTSPAAPTHAAAVAQSGRKIVVTFEAAAPDNGPPVGTYTATAAPVGGGPAKKGATPDNKVAPIVISDCVATISYAVTVGAKSGTVFSKPTLVPNTVECIK
jgi:hypothetical protein